MLKVFAILPALLIAAFAMYLQYRSLSEVRRRSPLWQIMCVVPVLTVGAFLLWIAVRTQ